MSAVESAVEENQTVAEIPRTPPARTVLSKPGDGVP
jgi:hypothetical protein